MLCVVIHVHSSDACRTAPPHDMLILMTGPDVAANLFKLRARTVRRHSPSRRTAKSMASLTSAGTSGGVPVRNVGIMVSADLCCSRIIRTGAQHGLCTSLRIEAAADGAHAAKHAGLPQRSVCSQSNAPLLLAAPGTTPLFLVMSRSTASLLTFSFAAASLHNHMPVLQLIP